jgi:hypothetical protein
MMRWDVATSITNEHSVPFVLDQVTTNIVDIDSCLCRLHERSRVARGRNYRCLVERVHASAADQPEKLVLYDRHGRAIGDSSTYIELTDNKVGVPIEDEQEEIEVAAKMQDCLLHEGLNDGEEPSLSDDAPRDEYTNTGVEHG